MSGIIYLACPYSDHSKDVREARFHAANEAAAHLIGQGKIVFSPISMTHPIDVVMAAEHETMGSDFWVTFDEAFMVFCDEMIILALPGWTQSAGIRREIEFFRSALKPVKLMSAAQQSYLELEALEDQHKQVEAD